LGKAEKREVWVPTCEHEHWPVSETYELYFSLLQGLSVLLSSSKVGWARTLQLQMTGLQEGLLVKVDKVTKLGRTFKPFWWQDPCFKYAGIDV
jgi:hypothetical protein